MKKNRNPSSYFLRFEKEKAKGIKNKREVLNFRVM